MDRSSSTSAYLVRFLRHPRQTWTDLLLDPYRLRYGFFAVLLVGIGYGITEGGIALSGGTPSPPWLAIPPADYFKWEALFSTPVTVACWLLAASVVYLLSKLFHGQGSFDDTAALLGFAIALATVISLIPDAARSVFTAAGVLNRAAWERAVAEPGTPDFLFLWAYMIAFVVALLSLFVVSIRAAQRLRGWPALVVGLLGAIVYQGVYFIFIR
jgi:hypothetical protein